MKRKASDEELVKGVQKGDETCFNQLYERYYRLVYFVAYELCQNDADAKDISQDTFLQVKKSIHSINEPAHFKSWLNQIVLSKTKNLFRKNKTQNLDNENPYYQNHLIEERTYMIPNATMHFKTDEELMHYFISLLPRTQREVLMLRYFQNYSMQEMADILGVPLGTVKTRLLYGKNALKKYIDQYQKENNINLNFRIEEASIVAAFASAYKAMLPPMMIQWNLPTKSLSHLAKTLTSSIAGKAAIVSTLALATGSGAYMAIQHQVQPRLSQNAFVEESEVNTHAKEYYFTLLSWANNTQELQLKTKEEITKIKPIYESLKRTESRYYERLVKDGWAALFEEKIKNQ